MVCISIWSFGVIEWWLGLASVRLIIFIVCIHSACSTVACVRTRRWNIHPFNCQTTSQRQCLSSFVSLRQIQIESNLKVQFLFAFLPHPPHSHTLSLANTLWPFILVFVGSIQTERTACLLMQHKNVPRKSEIAREAKRPGELGKDHLYAQKRASLDCEHLILLLIVQTDGITAAKHIYHIARCHNANRSTRAQGTADERIQKRKRERKRRKKRVHRRSRREKGPKKLMDGNRKRFVYLVAFVLLWIDITVKRSDFLGPPALGTLHIFSLGVLICLLRLASSHCCRSRSRPPSVPTMPGHTANYHFFFLSWSCGGSDGGSTVCPSGIFPFPLVSIFSFSLFFSYFGGCFVFFCISCHERAERYSYLFVIITRIWWTQAQRENVSVWLNLILFSNHLYFTYSPAMVQSRRKSKRSPAAIQRTRTSEECVHRFVWMCFCCSTNWLFRGAMSLYSKQQQQRRRWRLLLHAHSALPTKNSAILSAHLKYIWFIFFFFFSVALNIYEFLVVRPPFVAQAQSTARHISYHISYTHFFVFSLPLFPSLSLVIIMAQLLHRHHCLPLWFIAAEHHALLSIKYSPKLVKRSHLFR